MIVPDIRHIFLDCITYVHFTRISVVTSLKNNAYMYSMFASQACLHSACGSTRCAQLIKHSRIQIWSYTTGSSFVKFQNFCNILATWICTLTTVCSDSPNWVVFQPNIVIDAKLGCLWHVFLKLEPLVTMIPDKVSLHLIGWFSAQHVIDACQTI